MCNGPVDEFQLTLGRSYEGDWDAEKQEAAQDTLNKIAGAGEFVTSVLWEPADWALTARDCVSGDCSPLALLGLLPLIPGSKADDVVDIAKRLEDWLGTNLIGTRNKAGDFILRNADNTKRFRFDLLDPSPHSNPHMHLDWLNDAGEWVTHRIWPFGVDPK